MRQCTLFELHVRMQVNLGCLRGLMTEPKRNHAQVNAASKERHGRSVTKCMRRNSLRYQRRTGMAGATYVSCDEALEGISAELSTA